jgi:hypothetical protein
VNKARAWMLAGVEGVVWMRTLCGAYDDGLLGGLVVLRRDERIDGI